MCRGERGNGEDSLHVHVLDHAYPGKGGHVPNYEALISIPAEYYIFMLLVLLLTIISQRQPLA